MTFGRKELTKLLRRTGFATTEQLIPLPDYKTLVTVLYPAWAEEEDPPVDAAPFLRNCCRNDYLSGSEQYFFSLEAAADAVTRNGLFKDLCNSFFFVASPAEGNAAFDPDVYAVHYGYGRSHEYLKQTVF